MVTIINNLTISRMLGTQKGLSVMFHSIHSLNIWGPTERQALGSV